jgi:uncharacterized protein YlxW (UPF0749 family)
MPLLDLVTRQSLDQEYAHVARRRAAQGEPSRRGPGGLVPLAALALLGLLVATAAVQENRSAPVDATSRAQLIDQVDGRRESLARVQDRIGEQRAKIDTAERESTDLTTRLEAVQTRLTRLGARTGYGAVRGPGVRIEVNDSPSGIPEEAVRDSDLADLVNALWSVQAEAIAINGQRLTVLTGIRNVDVAIHLNGKPLSPPYVIEAIGDPRTLQADLVNSPRGQHFFALADALGLEYDMGNQKSMLLPAAPLSVLRAAAGPGTVDNGTVGTTEGGQP